MGMIQRLLKVAAAVLILELTSIEAREIAQLGSADSQSKRPEWMNPWQKL
jgi:hypothetical protein